MRMHGNRSGTLAAALPLVLGALGMTLVGAGAIWALVPLVMTGAGLAVIAFSLYLIQASLDKADRRRQAARAHRKAVQADFEADQRLMEPELPARSPLADAAVAALSGDEGTGGIYPPLPSQQAAPSGPPPVANWAPGGKIAPRGFDDGVVEFQEVPTGRASPPVPATPQVVVGHGAVAWNDTPATARVPSAHLEVDDQRDLRMWPGSSDLGRWGHFTGEAHSRTDRQTEEQIRAAMSERRKAIAGRLPTVGAILADVDAAKQRDHDMEKLRRQMDRGKCSKCEAMIWAPKQRPIVLKCPGCGHKAKLF